MWDFEEENDEECLFRPWYSIGWGESLQRFPKMQKLRVKAGAYLIASRGYNQPEIELAEPVGVLER